MRLRIFVIDDEECVSEPMRLYLEGQGHEVLCARDPTLCCVYQGEACNHEYPCGDIFFIDKQMPRMDGLTFIELMQKKGCKGQTKNKVVMSGALTQDDIDRAKKIGCIAVNKPLTFDQIDVLIEEMKKTIPSDRKLADLSAP